MVSVPLDCHPASFWRAYKRALSMSVIEAVGSHKPAALAAVRDGFREAHKLTQAGLIDTVRGAWFCLSDDYQAGWITTAMGYVPSSAGGLTGTLPKPGIRGTPQSELIATVEELISVRKPAALAGQHFDAYARAALRMNRFNKKVSIFRIWSCIAQKKAGLKARGEMTIRQAAFRRHKLMSELFGF